MKKRQQALNDRQFAILQTLAIKGKQTKSQLKTEFNIEYPAIDGSVKILAEKGLVEVVEKEKGIGKPKLFYGLTDKGLELLSTDSRLTLEKFWEIAFFIYDVSTNPKIKFLISNYFSNYEKKILGYDFAYTPLTWGIILDSFNILYQRPIKPSHTIAILFALGFYGRLTQSELTKYSTKNEFVEYTEEIPNMDEFLKNMISSKLIFRMDEKITKYRLSIAGFLLLMNYLDGIHSDILRNTKHKEYAQIVNTIIKNAKDIVPMISDNWNILRNIINELNIVQFFKFVILDTLRFSRSIQLNGMKELLIIERLMIETNRDTVMREYRIGLEAVSKLIRNTKFEGSSNVFNRLIFLGILSGFSAQNQDEFIKNIKGTEFSLDVEIEKSLSNIVCFEFFTHFIDWVIREKGMAGTPEEIEKDQLGKWHYSFVEKWNNFQKNNKEFHEWYNSWIKEIKKFEERNLKLLTERNFTSV